MDRRRTELFEISSYIRNVDNEVTLILQSLQWDRNHLLQGPPMVSCKYDRNHRVPPDKLKVHEEGCRLRSLGYLPDELLLPEPCDVNANTLVTLSKNDISHIIDYAAKVDPLFQKGRGAQDSEPLTLERLQLAYSRDERRAVHDAVVSAVPSCHDLADLALPSGDEAARAPRPRSRADVLAELRDMRRRRTKYRVAPKTRNYSDVLRDVIATQMEHFSVVHTESSEANSKVNGSKDYENSKEASNFRMYDDGHVKKEPVEDKSYSKDYESQQRKGDRSKEREREKKYDDYYKRGKQSDERDRYSSSSKERSRDKNEYRSSDKYRREDSRDPRKSHKERSTKPSRNSDVRYKREREYDSYSKSHREKEHRRYYDYKEDEFDTTRKRIKQEKD